jgi:hypothetical protein
MDEPDIPEHLMTALSALLHVQLTRSDSAPCRRQTHYRRIMKTNWWALLCHHRFSPRAHAPRARVPTPSPTSTLPLNVLSVAASCHICSGQQVTHCDRSLAEMVDASASLYLFPHAWVAHVLQSPPLSFRFPAGLECTSSRTGLESRLFPRSRPCAKKPLCRISFPSIP